MDGLPQVDIVDEQNDSARLGELDGDLLIGDDPIGSFLDSVSGFFGTDVPKFIAAHRGAIADAATVLAGVGATALLGPAGGALAAGLAKSQIDAAAGSGQQKADAQKKIDDAHAAAQTDPAVGKAHAIADQSTKQATAGYIIAANAEAGAAGDPKARAAMAKVDAAAAAGDPHAKKIKKVADESKKATNAGDSIQSGAAHGAGAGALPALAVGVGLAALIWALV
jgi:hypothetical protein